ncbi:hypothetical protein J3L14_05940 [Burkholderia pseudomallei]|uniref:hypothetical protein n=1 Tax=Burkholderia pseudomallei TaxID=28450 RepID=UPI0011078B80|nr:hypothetical protein [Burkholderia pseudomallei]QCU53091.1 hypothetical protein FFM54_27500 [Burkholderia pseudomallei]QTB80420.1 hypothetical protein J3L14_05940 [Burkholderia pseudomallei]
MSYCLTKAPTFTMKVTVVEPGTSSSGDVETHEFVAVFKRISMTEWDEMRASGRADQSIIADLLVGWHGLVDATGNDVPFTSETRDSLLSIPHALRGTVVAFMTGASGAGLKN